MSESKAHLYKRVLELEKELADTKDLLANILVAYDPGYVEVPNWPFSTKKMPDWLLWRFL